MLRPSGRGLQSSPLNMFPPLTQASSYFHLRQSDVGCLPGPGKYMGCFEDAPKRDLEISGQKSSKMTPELCSQQCKKYHYYGLQNSDECWCGASDWTPRYKKVLNRQCNKPCTGDVESMCGGGWRNNIWKQPESMHSKHPIAKKKPTPKVKVTEHTDMTASFESKKEIVGKLTFYCTDGFAAFQSSNQVESTLMKNKFDRY